METMEQISYSCEEERTYSMLCHLSALSGLIIPFGHFLGPLVIWLIKKDQYAEVDRQGKDALNFQLSLTIYLVIAAFLIILVVGLVLLPVIFLFGLAYSIIASVKSSNCERFEYPLTIKIFN